MIGIVDYGTGNLKSVRNAFQFLGLDPFIIESRKDFSRAEKIVLPGVGAFRDAAQALRETKFDDEIRKAIQAGKYFLGICLGMQLLFEKSKEYGEYEGLGILKGEIVRFSGLQNGEKVPHMGWNSLDIRKPSPLFQKIPQKPYVYFVHSYHLKTEEEELVSATTFYGSHIQVAVERENIFALQFHPEKSGNVGLQMLKNFGGL